MEITGRLLIEAVIAKIAAKYADIPIYDEKSTQDFKKPCFFVNQLQTFQENKLRNYYLRKYNIVIRYHAENDITSNYEEFDNVRNTLYNELIKIDVGEFKIKGYNMYDRVENNVLQFFASYNLNVKEELPLGTKMNTLEIQTAIE